MQETRESERVETDETFDVRYCVSCGSDDVAGYMGTNDAAISCGDCGHSFGVNHWDLLRSYDPGDAVGRSPNAEVHDD